MTTSHSDAPSTDAPDIDDPDLPLSAVFAAWPDSAPVFLERRMICPGCPIAPFHSLSDACAEYGQDEARLRETLRRIAR